MDICGTNEALVSQFANYYVNLPNNDEHYNATILPIPYVGRVGVYLQWMPIYTAHNEYYVNYTQTYIRT